MDFYSFTHSVQRPRKVTVALSEGFCCVQVNSVLKLLLSTFTCTQNAPAEL